MLPTFAYSSNMQETTYLRAFSLLILYLPTLAFSEAAKDQEPGVVLDGKFIPQVIASDYNKHHKPNAPSLNKRQVPGAVCIHDDLLAAANSGPYWTTFCSSFIGAPTTQSTLEVTPTTFVTLPVLQTADSDRAQNRLSPHNNNRNIHRCCANNRIFRLHFHSSGLWQARCHRDKGTCTSSKAKW